MSDTPKLRILIKLSGEALMGSREYGIDPAFLAAIALELVATRRELGVELALVVGGGNIFRGLAGAAAGMDRSTADQIGMLATLQNALALRDAIERAGNDCRIQSAYAITQVAEGFQRREAIRALTNGELVIFAAGTGNPFFTTDSAAALRAVEIGAGLLLKATKVDGIYDADPRKVATAQRFDRISFDEVLRRDLKIMDATAFTLCREQRLPILVCSLLERGSMIAAIGALMAGSDRLPGTLVSADQGV